MSEYVNFIQDFPKRCHTLLTRNYEECRNTNTEVTLMLTIATSGFIIPYNRLAESDHPSGDAKDFTEAKTQFNRFGGQNFLNSSLVSSRANSSWGYREDLTLPDSKKIVWEKLLQGPSTISTKPVAAILAHFRNALAHGNIFTYENPIESLLFLSQDKQNNEWTGMYNMISVSTQDFHYFLIHWFDFLSTLKMPETIKQEEA